MPSGTGTVTAGAYVNVGTATGTTPTGSNITDTDPSHYTGEAPAVSILIEKSTNDAAGVPQDADAAPGPTLAAGDTVTWTYVVTNDGGGPLTNVTVTDNDNSLTLSCPGGIPDPFAPGASASFTCTATGVAVQGQYENTATATGDHTASGQTVTDSDLSHYFVPTPAAASIRLEKSTNGADADSPTDPNVPQIPQGQQVTWTYDVTNTGGVALSNVFVTDDKIGAVCTITNSGGFLLEPNVTESCTATGVAQAGAYANIGTVTGTPTSGGPNVTDTDMSHYVGLASTIDIEKATNGQDADSTPVQVNIGATVTWELRGEEHERRGPGQHLGHRRPGGDRRLSGHDPARQRHHDLHPQDRHCRRGAVCERGHRYRGDGRRGSCSHHRLRPQSVCRYRHGVDRHREVYERCRWQSAGRGCGTRSAPGRHRSGHVDVCGDEITAARI